MSDTNEILDSQVQPDQWQAIVLPAIARAWQRRKAIASFAFETRVAHTKIDRVHL